MTNKDTRCKGKKRVQQYHGEVSLTSLLPNHETMPRFDIDYPHDTKSMFGQFVCVVIPSFMALSHGLFKEDGCQHWYMAASGEEFLRSTWNADEQENFAFCKLPDVSKLWYNVLHWAKMSEEVFTVDLEVLPAGC